MSNCGSLYEKIASCEIVIFHLGHWFYKWPVLRHILAYNPDARVWVVTDRDIPVTSPRIRVVLAKDVWKRASTVAELYRHGSLNRRSLELLCIQRWFAILELMEREGLQALTHIDSDVLVFQDLNADPILRQGDVAFSRRMGPNILACTQRKVLEVFCAWVEEVYSTDAAWSSFQKEFWSLRGAVPPGGGISDMAFWEVLAARGTFRYIDSFSVVDGAAHDHHMMNIGDGFVMDGPVKRIRWDHAHPVGEKAGTGERVRLKSMHFQGRAKRFMLSHSSPLVEYSALDRASFWLGWLGASARKIPGAVLRALRYAKARRMIGRIASNG